MFAADTPAIVAVITSHPDKVVEMSTLMMAGMAASQKEEGIKMYEACVNQSKPNEFAFIECYRDLKATATHSKEPHFKAMNKGMRSLLGGKPSLHILKRSLYAPATAPSPGSVVTTSTIQCTNAERRHICIRVCVFFGLYLLLLRLLYQHQSPALY